MATSVTLDFEGTPEASVRIFGSEDLWGGMDYAWFAARYRLPAATVFVMLPLVGWVRRKRSPPPVPERRIVRWITGALIWTAISAGAYAAILIVPLLLPYTGFLALGAVTAVVGVQLLVGFGLGRWIGRSVTQ